MSTGLEFTDTATLVTTECCACGITFAVPRWWNQQRRATHEDFYCPNGHSLTYEGKSDADRAREAKLAQSIAEAQAREARAQLEQEQAKHRRLRKRVKAGVCPCCQRTFTCLARHLKAKHPEYAK